MPHRTRSCNKPSGLLKGQTLIQLEQSVPFDAQKSRHDSALMCQASTPLRFEMLYVLTVGLPYGILPLEHFWAHFLHIMQKSHTPNSIGLSGAMGRSVKTFARRTLGPYKGVTSSPFRANSPRPASMAIGMLQAVSFPHGSASNPRPRMYWARRPAVKAIRE